MKKRSVLLGAAAAVMLMTAGCQSKYEKVEVPGTAAETVAQVGTDAAAQAAASQPTESYDTNDYSYDYSGEDYSGGDDCSGDDDGGGDGCLDDGLLN